MKKIFRILFLMFISSQLTFAQGSDPVFHFGLKVLPNLGWIKTDDTSVKGDGSKLGFAYGLVTEFRFADNYAFATGLDVTYRNAKLKGEENSIINDSISSKTISKASMKLQYIEIPLTLKLKTNEIGYFRYFLQIGVAPAFKIRARGDVSGTTATTKTVGTTTTDLGTETFDEENVDIKDDINNLNISMVVSGGVEYNLSGNTNLVLGLVFNNGFSDIADGDLKQKSNFFGLSVGVLF